MRKLGLAETTTRNHVLEAIEAFHQPLVEATGPMPYAKQTLYEIKKRGYKIGLISNQTWPVFVMKILRKLQLSQYFDSLTISGDVGSVKSHPKIFEVALNALGIRAEEAVYVGDLYRIDYLGDRRVGMHAIPVSQRDYESVRSIRSLRELRKLL